MVGLLQRGDYTLQCITINSVNALAERECLGKRCDELERKQCNAKQCNAVQNSAVQCDDVDAAVLYAVVWPQRVDSRHRMSDLQ